ncbi:MAG: C4-dicarboxylate ABC transporter substrate-binding protein [Arcobacter sp.]|nr:MAG: C4-dicarboxylate ABC transporter substrate-binding protein [Arcobacter sp.]
MQNIFTRGALFLAGSMVLSSALYAKTETLIVHHFMSSKAPTHTKLLMPWAKKIEEASKGKLKVEIFPTMTMGGKPNELYKQARDGVSDIVWTLAGYTPGVFPRTEVYELPTVHKGDSLATTIAIRENMDLIEGDYKDVVPLLIHAAAGNAIHTVNKKITSVKDLKGLKFRTPSRSGGWLIEEYGAEPVGMPLPALPQALSKNAIDGALVPFEVFPPYKFHQLTHYSYEGVNKERFGTSIFMMLMNKKRFNKLSPELQKIILDNSGMELSKFAGQLWMDLEEPGKKMQNKSKDSEVVKFDKKTLDEFDKAGQKVVDKWIIEAKEKGIDGQKLVDTARETISKYSK